MQEDIFIIFMNEKNFIIFIIKYIIYKYEEILLNIKKDNGKFERRNFRD